MKEFINLYRIVWKNHGGSKGFLNGQFFGAIFCFAAGVMHPQYVLSIWAVFMVLYLGLQISIAMKEAPEGVDTAAFEKGRIILMVKTTLSVYLFSGFTLALIIMYYLVSHFVGLPQTS